MKSNCLRANLHTALPCNGDRLCSKPRHVSIKRTIQRSNFTPKASKRRLQGTDFAPSESA